MFKTLKKSRVQFNPVPIGVDIFRVGAVDCRVTGQGFWYNGSPRKYACSVHVGLDNNLEGSDSDCLRIFAVPQDYNLEKRGLIYTDSRFVRDIKAFFKGLGMPAWSTLDYTEQGMQGFNYVDMVVTSRRATKWVQERVKGHS